LSIKKQKEPGKTTEETSECVRLERVSKWANFMIATGWWWWWCRCNEFV